MEFLDIINLITGLFDFRALIPISDTLLLIILILISSHVLFFIKLIFAYVFTALKKVRYHSIQIYHPKVSIIIPAHNESLGIRECIESAIHLDYKNKEIIVIDDGSMDNTSDIAREYERKGLIKFFQRRNTSSSKAQASNYASVFATGEILCMTDGDFRFSKESIKNAVKYFQDNDVLAVSGNIVVDQADPGLSNSFNRKLLGGIQKYEYIKILEIEKTFSSFTKSFLPVSGSLALVRKNIFESVGKFDKDTIIEDYDLTAKIWHSFPKGKIIYAPDVIGHTYVPAMWSHLFRQRERWTTGLVQVLRKHSDAFKRNNYSLMFSIGFDFFKTTLAIFLFFYNFSKLGFGLVGANIFSGQSDFFPYINIDLLFDYIYSNDFLLVTVIYMAVEYATFFSIVAFTRRYDLLKKFYLIPFYFLFYNTVLKFIKLKSFLKALRNPRPSW